VCKFTLDNQWSIQGRLYLEKLKQTMPVLPTDNTISK